MKKKFANAAENDGRNEIGGKREGGTEKKKSHLNFSSFSILIFNAVLCCSNRD